MSPIILKRMLSSATQSIVKKSALDVADVELACDALAQLLSQSSGVLCQITLSVGQQATVWGIQPSTDHPGGGNGE